MPTAFVTPPINVEDSILLELVSAYLVLTRSVGVTRRQRFDTLENTRHTLPKMASLKLMKRIDCGHSDCDAAGVSCL